MYLNILGTILTTIDETTFQNAAMSPKDWLTTLVPAFITLLGFVITYFSLRKSFKDEIRKQKTNIALDKMSTIPFETLDLYEKITTPIRVSKQIAEIEGKRNISKGDQVRIQKLKTEKREAEDSLYDKMTNLYNTIYAYGSIESIKIVSSMQKINYGLNIDASSEERFIIIAHMILLASQVKKDVTNITVNPKQWFEMKITDYEEKRKLFDPLVNKVVDDLGLDEGFKILS
ncbi:MAG: hypothetical protein MSA90_02345 [Faecalicatena sp.]|uniref:hypothetical protein n=1 Tax=Faecalicatena sp. TaxID=2005360 RepID=UPI002584B05E|nr:hypothetical protein [Faecalicatena sp.]MCI6464296.1 hypothetical protein [Faecalicatena sp.]MDY4668463.1 hypothetical protein [Oliverpabstia sp.]MDY5621270.1 hypothetical protein [Lachnospiraceae bacterium]